MTYPELINLLWEEKQAFCPHVGKDDIGCFCKNLNNERMVCDTASLQFWCLTDNYENCHFFKGEN